jgi:hypothetical protein
MHKVAVSIEIDHVGLERIMMDIPYMIALHAVWPDNAFPAMIARIALFAACQKAKEHGFALF